MTSAMTRSFFNRIAWLQALTVLAVLLPIAGGGLYVWSVHQRAQSRLTDLEPRYARLAGLVERRADLKTLGVQVGEELARLAYPAAQDVTKAGNDAQQRIRALYADSKLDIISIQVLPARQEDKESKFDRISIDLRVEGDLTGMQNALALLASQTPVVLVDSLALQTIGAVKPASTQRLGGQFNFAVLRLRP